MAKPTIIYDLKDDYVEAKIIGGTVASGITATGTIYKNISYVDFYNIMQATQNSTEGVRATATSELGAVLSAVASTETSNNQNIGEYPKGTIRFTKTDGNYVLKQITNGSNSFKTFTVPLDNGKVKKFDTHTFIISTDISLGVNGFTINSLRAELLLDIAYVPNRTPNTVEIPVLTAYLNRVLANSNVAKIKDVPTLDKFKNLDIAQLREVPNGVNALREIGQAMQEPSYKINWGEL